MSFIGREKELKLLRKLSTKRSASFVVIRGRRRIGKSRLIEEFGQASNYYLFSGIPPTKMTTRQSQLDHFCSLVSQQFNFPKFKVDNWGELFFEMGKACQKRRMVIALDEISWIGSKDPDFLGHLKNAWDVYFSKNPKLILIACGSVSSWIEQNILSSTGFVGRISIDLHLEELPLTDAAKFWNQKTTSAFDILKTLSVTGGVPRYLEEIRPQWSTETNIQNLFFQKDGLLFREFDQIFSDLFSSKAHAYAEVVRLLAHRPSNFGDIVAATKKAESTISTYLNDLRAAGFIAEDPTWNLRTTKLSQLKKYRLSDNYLRFYLKYVEPNKGAITKGLYELVPLSSLPNWDAVMGLQFENLVLNNVPLIIDAIDAKPSDVAFYGPFFQRKTQRHQGCQVDLLIQTRHRLVYLCEVKFSSNHVGMEAVHAMEEKQKRLSLPRGWSMRSVLIHVNGVTSSAIQSDTFDYIVDFSELVR